MHPVRRYFKIHSLAPLTRYYPRKVQELVVCLLPRESKHYHHDHGNGYQAQDYTEPAQIILLPRKSGSQQC